MPFRCAAAAARPWRQWPGGPFGAGLSTFAAPLLGREVMRHAALKPRERVGRGFASGRAVPEGAP